MLTRRLFLACVTAAPLASVASADQPMVHARAGAAIGGYDPVAYFTQGRPVKGRPGEAVMWKGAEWRFASAGNREAFEANPRAYAPKYGGYCAYAMSRGYAAPADPAAWKIEGGRLYLNHNVNVREIWSEDIPGNIRRADANWPAALGR